MDWKTDLANIACRDCKEAFFEEKHLSVIEG